MRLLELQGEEDPGAKSHVKKVQKELGQLLDKEELR
jgi:hypothetical protein